MIIQGTPNRVVQRMKRKHDPRLPDGSRARKRVIPWFKFDENGFAEIDETKLSVHDVAKLKKAFKVVESKPKKKKLTEEELRAMAKEQGVKSWHVKSVKTLKKELGV